MSLLVEEYYPEKGYSSNCLVLTAETLEIKHRSHRYLLPLYQIEDVRLSHVRLLFYYLVGGFTLTLSLIAVLSNFIGPLLGILLILLGATSLYIGLRGKISLQISTTTDDYVFWFSGSYQPFLQFINVVRHRVITHQLPESGETPASFE